MQYSQLALICSYLNDIIFTDIGPCKKRLEISKLWNNRIIVHLHSKSPSPAEVHANYIRDFSMHSKHIDFDMTVLK